MLYLAFAVYSVVTFQWFFCKPFLAVATRGKGLTDPSAGGYSLAFSDSAKTSFIGDLKHFGMMGVLDQPSAGSLKIPAIGESLDSSSTRRRERWLTPASLPVYAV